MANYKVGDEVICICAKKVAPGSSTPVVKLGKIYKVFAARESPCCGCLEIDVAEKSPTGWTQCICGARKEGTWHLSWRFIKLDGLSEDTTEKQELETY